MYLEVFLRQKYDENFKNFRRCNIFIICKIYIKQQHTQVSTKHSLGLHLSLQISRSAVCILRTSYGRKRSCPNGVVLDYSCNPKIPMLFHSTIYHLKHNSKHFNHHLATLRQKQIFICNIRL